MSREKTTKMAKIVVTKIILGFISCSIDLLFLCSHRCALLENFKFVLV